MNAICSICSERLRSTEKFSAPQCGHIFHEDCLAKWTKRSLTCPECRQKTTKLKIRRVFLNFSPHDSVMEDSIAETVRIIEIQTLQQQVTDNEKKLIESRKKNEDLQNANQQLVFQLTQNKAAAYMEVELLKTQLAKMINFRNLLNTPVASVEDIIGQTRDPDTLIQYLSGIKRELCKIERKYEKSQKLVEKLEQDVKKMSAEREESAEKIKQLEKKVVASNVQATRVPDVVIDLTDDSSCLSMPVIQKDLIIFSPPAPGLNPPNHPNPRLPNAGPLNVAKRARRSK